MEEPQNIQQEIIKIKVSELMKNLNTKKTGLISVAKKVSESYT